MNCPHCNVSLVMSERQGVEIDYCPQCRGVWLDRGELDKILERQAALEQRAAAAAGPGAPPPIPQQPYQQQPPPPPYGAPRRHDDDDDDDDRYKRGGHYGQGQGGPYPHRKKSWLAELFD
jgi:Zn-finger nucleic acid-binding protein